MTEFRSKSSFFPRCPNSSPRSKRIPEPREAAVAEVHFVDGGEVGDALLDEDERGLPIVGAAAGEIGGAEFRPEGVMEVPGVGRKARGEWRFFHNAGHGWISARADFREVLAVCWSW